MTNSDYLLKAAIKKVTEKLNEILVEKIEEATNIAQDAPGTVSYTHLRAHETKANLVCRLLLEKKKLFPHKN